MKTAVSRPLPLPLLSPGRPRKSFHGARVALSSIKTEGLAMAEETKSGGNPAAVAAAAAVAPDPLTAELLAKHSAGEKLTPSEYGKLGAFKSGLKKLFGKGGAPGPGSQPAQPAAGAGNLLLWVPWHRAKHRLIACSVPVDPRLAQKTTAVILNAADGVACRYIARKARGAGADDKTVASFDSASALSAPSKELMIETSPELLAQLGVDPHNYPVMTFLGGMGLWATNLWLCVDELKALQKKDAPAPAPRGPAAAKSTPMMEPRHTLQPPPPPPGAPPNVTAGEAPLRHRHDRTMPGRNVTICAGISGTGKSTLGLRYLINGDLSYRFLFDPDPGEFNAHLGEFADRLGLQPARDVYELSLALCTGWVAFDPHALFPGRLQEAFDFFCEWAWEKSALLPGNKILVVDEAWAYQTPQGIPAELADHRAERAQARAASDAEHPAAKPVSLFDPERRERVYLFQAAEPSGAGSGEEILRVQPRGSVHIPIFRIHCPKSEQRGRAEGQTGALSGMEAPDKLFRLQGGDA